MLGQGCHDGYACNGVMRVMSKHHRSQGPFRYGRRRESSSINGRNMWGLEGVDEEVVIPNSTSATRLSPIDEGEPIETMHHALRIWVASSILRLFICCFLLLYACLFSSSMAVPSRYSPKYI